MGGRQGGREGRAKSAGNADRNSCRFLFGELYEVLIYLIDSHPLAFFSPRLPRLSDFFTLFLSAPRESSLPRGEQLLARNLEKRT